MSVVARLHVPLVGARASVRSECREGRVSTVRPWKASVSGSSLSITGSRRTGVTGRVSKLHVVAGPQIEPDTDGSALDFPQEWMKPGPSRRPDIFPEFQPIKPPLPQPMPGDPEEPEEEFFEEEEEIDPDDPDQEPPPEEE
mmetsp:Transcript_9103/g.18847  ORF Transcript_9103/g.18847 Transcript_9103/m.18847 type:complete len:141 (-) Transcript_9103:340-762(-)|eukprot:CAMPEP_0118930424 /NCGR_PEP_ID=MMETSP1169-20130426/7118_1 /TAXON_ID=36882 /ORGANISM="Pyramimonas obovata, Strain CCMP722" /LENGTH=140 /DNA_ID=CAMNT_0006872779 /DNA_START=95 /DNA_END=517 /DNA_ORIENTATION=+